jgi:hypothetical protein
VWNAARVRSTRARGQVLRTDGLPARSRTSTTRFVAWYLNPPGQGEETAIVCTLVGSRTRTSRLGNAGLDLPGRGRCLPARSRTSKTGFGDRVLNPSGQEEGVGGGTRTRVLGVRGRHPWPLDDTDRERERERERRGEPRGSRALQRRFADGDPHSRFGSKERTAGIEPAFSAWKAVVLPLDDVRDVGMQRSNGGTGETRTRIARVQTGSSPFELRSQWWSWRESHPHPPRAKRMLSY